ncbi:protein of unknown function DUF302 [Rhizobium leguminosarum bv. trifolii WSM1325]|uniref:DUF302 domain-containing protein n=1 Tax=Rhizobium leguminosarum bv. trifolii (strain WSM1325) TaxID=395491 RepID=C6AVN7_RHILS|nr:DUF302 domain-containing protein [Rhizobium leguminosarum]ACS55848.1 protein of unknown function DUF302 [Rhizobium leguminosarum bv. trifolii WSM1325]
MHLKPVEHRTSHSFEETLETVRKAVGKVGMSIFAEVDHAKAARENGLSMPETRVLVYGNPKAGTPVMLDTPLAALDLPLRILVRELPGHNSAVAFHPIAEMFEELGVKREVAARFDAVQQTIIDEACGGCPTGTDDHKAASRHS